MQSLHISITYKSLIFRGLSGIFDQWKGDICSFEKEIKTQERQ